MINTAIESVGNRWAKSLALLLFSLAAAGAGADFVKTNPVTGKTENYTWKFVGSNTWNGKDYWQNSDGTSPGHVPQLATDDQTAEPWEPLLFDGSSVALTQVAMSVQGWNLRLGLYDGAQVNLQNLQKIQGDTTMWVTVDDTSQFTVSGHVAGNLSDNQIIKFSTTKENGIKWTTGFVANNSDSNTIEPTMNEKVELHFCAFEDVA